jgi:hypothetical protein
MQLIVNQPGRLFDKSNSVLFNIFWECGNYCQGNQHKKGKD